MLIGFEIAGIVKDAYTAGTVSDWKMVWIIPSIIALVVFILFAIAFHDKNEKPVEQTATI